MIITSFLPGISPKLAGRAAKSQSRTIAEKLEQIKEAALSELAELFANQIPPSLLQRSLQKDKSRNRTFNCFATFWGFLSQVFSPETSCQEVVREIQASALRAGKAKPSSANVAYVKARKALDIKGLEKIHHP